MHRFVLTLLLSSAATALWAQQPAETHAFSLEESVQYALENNQDVRNAILDRRAAWSRKNETRAQGLPQLNANGQLIYNYKIPRQAISIGGETQILQFGQNYTSNGSVSVSQLLFDGRYITALQASKVYQELVRIQSNRTSVDVAEAVSKAYYSTLVARRRLDLLASNRERQERIIAETRVQVENGLAETIEVNRLQVALNNLDTDIENAQASLVISELALKFQMGMPFEDNLVLTDSVSLDGSDIAAERLRMPDSTSFDVRNRIEYRELLKTREFGEFDVKQYRSGYLPNLTLNADYGFNSFGDKIGELYRNSTTFGNGSVSLGLNIPIFDGFLKRSQIEQARYRNEQTENRIRQAEQSLGLEYRQANVNMTNALRKLEIQRQSLELASEVYRQAQIKYNQGVGSNLEVVLAEQDFKDAQTNLVNALLDAYIAQVDLKAALGILLEVN